MESDVLNEWKNIARFTNIIIRFEIYSIERITLFSLCRLDSQRKGLEKRFQMQKYISKPDRKKLAERLGLKDSQVIMIVIIFFLIRPKSDPHLYTQKNE